MKVDMETRTIKLFTEEYNGNFEITHLIVINVDRQPAINKMDNKIAKDNKAALIFGCRSPVGRYFGNDIISNAEADKI